MSEEIRSFLIMGMAVEASIETIFGLPRVGRFVIGAFNTRDYSIISGIILLISITVLVANLFINLTYA